MKNRPWPVLCWGAALVLALNWVIRWLCHPEPSLLFPAGSGDTCLYTFFIQRASEGFTTGDPFFWEHRSDPASIFSIFHFWPLVYGNFYRVGGEPLLLCISIFLSGLWFYSVFYFCLRLGQARPYAFFVAGVQTFFVVNHAYLFAGFGMDFSAQHFWGTEHERLYPTVTAMAFYNFSAAGVLWALEGAGSLPMIVAAVLVALTAYGRPFDWMIMLGALGVLALFASVLKNRRVARRAFVLLILAVLGSAVFIFQFMEYQQLHRAVYFDQNLRGSIQVKLPSHYFKYTAMCVGLLGAAGLAYRKSLIRPAKGAGKETGDGEVVALRWLLALAASSLLVHFKTALEGGVTIGGFLYQMVFSIIPWFFMLTAHFCWQRWGMALGAFFSSKVWVVALFALLITQQMGIAIHRIPGEARLEGERMIHAVGSAIRNSGIQSPVVLSSGENLKLAILADSWFFYSDPLLVTYASSAPTAELLDRFLLTKLLLTGSIRDLAPLFSSEGVPHVRSWLASQSPAFQRWALFLEHGVGANTFIIHPYKNRGELRLRRISLPEPLKACPGFVAYFPADLRQVFLNRESSLEDKPCAVVLKELQRRYRLDMIYIPPANLRDVDLDRLRNCPGLSEVQLGLRDAGVLWKVEENKDK